MISVMPPSRNGNGAGGGGSVKQADDLRTLELTGLDARRRPGRPPKPDALTAAQRARTYRAKKRLASGWPAPTTVAVLFARHDSIYKRLPGCDVWDMERDARQWPGGAPVVAHPPCRAWGRLRGLAKPRPDEKDLAIFAIAQVREFGGVLEHPAASSLWRVAGLPEPGQVDQWGGYTLPIHQFWFGHRADKKTWLYVVGCPPERVPPVPIRAGLPTHVVTTSMRRRGEPGYKPQLHTAEREHTPPELALWLVELARRCRGP